MKHSAAYGRKQQTKIEQESTEETEQWGQNDGGRMISNLNAKNEEPRMDTKFQKIYGI